MLYFSPKPFIIQQFRRQRHYQRSFRCMAKAAAENFSSKNCNKRSKNLIPFVSNLYCLLFKEHAVCNGYNRRRIKDL